MADRAFVVEPPGDLALALAAARVAAGHWGLPDPVFMRSGMNALFASGDDIVLRVGRPTVDPEAAVWLAGELRKHGVRVPVYARLDAVRAGSLAVFAIERVATVVAVDWCEVGQMVARVHRLDAALISVRYPTPPCTSFPWWEFDRLLDDVADLLDPTALAGIERALSRHAGWMHHAGANVLCHGDLHPGNVLQTTAGPMIIDWDLLCLGPPQWDHGPLMTWTERWGGQPDIYEAFAVGYGSSCRGDRVAEAVAELRLVAATLMKMRAGRTDAGAAVEAERRLRWWRGDPDAPQWRAA